MRLLESMQNIGNRQMGSHKEFILSPITDILKDAVTASAGIGNGIETYPLYDYILQSVFLKMTGSQEQKMKCIVWELATNDYEYRRVLLGNDDKLGECSSYEAKNKIYKRLVAQIQSHISNFNVQIDINKTQIQQNTIADLKKVFLNSNLSMSSQKVFTDYLNNRTLIQTQHFTNNASNLFENILQDRYKMLYNHRNRSAHNTFSYQQNLPTLSTLLSEDYKYDNYIVRFALLVLIDKIFIELYTIYNDIID